MGLDQYLTRKFYVGGKYDHRHVTGEINIKIGDQQYNFDVKNVDYITESAGYWRKANAIHQWFVDNCQGGDDERRSVYVEREQLETLLAVVNTVLKSCTFAGRQHLEANKAVCEELLPTASGFFFGNTDYGEYYYQDLLNTKQILEQNLDAKYADWEFEYSASW